MNWWTPRRRIEHVTVVTCTYLIIALVGEERPLLEDHPQAEQEHDQAVTAVAEHDAEQEREADDGERRWNKKRLYVTTQPYSTWRQHIQTVHTDWSFSRL